MRLFGSEKITKIMDRMGFKEGDVIEHPMISKSIERAQKKVEENHFGVRKRLLEYDDVMNSQREVIYKKRRETLMGERLGVNIMNMIYDAIYGIVEDAKMGNDYEYFKEELLLLANIEPPVSQNEFLTTKIDALTDKSFAAAMASFKHNMDAIADQVAPEVARVIEEFGDQYINIVIPISDGTQTYRVPVNLKEANETKGKAAVKTFEKAILLHEIDEYWKDHLRDMDDLRDSVQNASYEQKDPLLIYKKESFELFRKMVEGLNKKTVSILMRSHIEMPQQQVAEEEPKAPEVPVEKKVRAPEYTETRTDSPAAAPTQEPRITEPVHSDKVVGRNDPCPCGSGKKYKNCHGADL